MKQVTNTVLMIRPVNFRMNEQTAVNNYFQEDLDIKNREINERAQHEFDMFVVKLRSVGINVIVVNDRLETDTPDSIFPNNWVSFHDDGTVAVFPMFAENRRLERREDIFDILEEQGFYIKRIIDYTSAEEENLFLEATGSLCLDGINQKAYCALSPRADEDLCIEFCEDFEYTPVLFTAYQSVEGKRLPIYHTNVMMCIGNTFAVVCLSTIDDKKERKNVIKHLKSDGKEIIDITEEQMNNFAGNMLQLKGSNDASYIVMSEAAYNSLTETQVERLKAHGNILYSPLDTIETCGGGSARCMLAEVFLPRLEN
ncbi:MAG TPA: arginine deiminase-related protein [Flavobacteriaceae bacterium]|nr:arginine deiminase-related protein [Flavobacteriaceae bacterium]